MSGKAERRKYFRPLDIFVLIIFLVIAIAGVELFRRDLLQTFRLHNVEPVGTIVIKRNIVQRRLSDRVVWDRLVNESPVYLGDLIRIAEISAATLYVDANSIDIDENTLIRIMRAADGQGLRIILSEGSLSLAAEEHSKSITLDLNGQQVQTGQGTVLNASVRDDRQSVQVNAGAALYISQSGEAREISAGALVATDTEGRQLVERAVVFTQPFPNMRYVKTGTEPMSVNLTWNRINLESGMLLRLEISQDSGFARITNTINNLNRETQARFDTGLWYYRVLYQNEVLGTGQLTVADGSGPQLISPAFNSLFLYQNDIPEINFQWARINDAISYNLEVSSAADFNSAQIRMLVSSTSQKISSLEEGMWFWRVQPVFPAVYNARGSFSAPAFFRIVRSAVEPNQDVSLAAWIASQTPSNVMPPGLPPGITPAPVAASQSSQVPQIVLNSPANGAQIAGLTALRQQTVFRWSANEEITSSRFILSRNANPLQSPTRIIPNPSQNINIDNLATGTWYWTVEMITVDGLTIRANTRSLQVMPILLLPAPGNLQPANGSRLGQTALSARSIVFRWAAVSGANAYNFTLYQQLQGSRRQIVNTRINNSTTYTLSGLNLLGRGNFVWQVQPVNVRGGVIEQSGNTSTSTFIIDIPSPGPVQIEDTGILYGN